MKVALIACPAWAVWAPSPALLLLAAGLRREGHRVDIFDLNIDAYRWMDEKDRSLWQDENSIQWEIESVINELFEKYSAEFRQYAANVVTRNPDLVGFSVNSGARYTSPLMAKLIRQAMPKVPIVFGGADCFRSEWFDSYMIPGVVDALCPGEGDIALPHLAGIVEKTGRLPSEMPGFLTWNNGRTQDNGNPVQPHKLDDLAPISLEGVDLSRYTKPNRLAMSISRGCINHCTFCSEGNNFRPHTSHSAEYMFEQVVSILPALAKSGQIPHINFNHSLINANIGILTRFCELLVSNNIELTWGGVACIRQEMTPDVLKLLRRAGCVEIRWGVESGSGKVLKLMGKRFTPRLLDRVIRDTAMAGIAQYGDLIVGFPGEGPREFAESLLFLLKNVNKFVCMGLPILSPRKNSAIYNEPDCFGMSGPDPELWESVDGRNTPKIRILRRTILESVLREKKFDQGGLDQLISRTKVEIEDHEIREEYQAIFSELLDITKSYLTGEPAVMPLLGGPDLQEEFPEIPAYSQTSEPDLFEFKKQNIRRFQNLIKALQLGEVNPMVDYLPMEIFLELTKRCNLDCIMCSHGIEFKDFLRKNPGAPVDFPADALGAFKELLPAAAMVYLVGLGEPLLHPEIAATVQRFAENGTFVWVNSNGMKMTLELAEKLVESRLSRFVFSVSGGTGGTYERVHKGAGWNMLWEAIETIHRAKLNRNASWPQLFFNFVVMDENIRELPELIAQLAPFDPAGVSVKPLVNMGGLLDCVENPPRIRTFQEGDRILLDEAQQTAKLLGFELEDHSYRGNHRALEKKDGICLHPFSTLSVTACGDVYPCGQGESVGGRELIVGNIKKNSLLEIWNGEPLRKLREDIARKQYGKGCLECISKQLCRLHNDQCDTTAGFQGAIDSAKEIYESSKACSPPDLAPKVIQSNQKLWAPPPLKERLIRTKERNFYRYILSRIQERDIVLNTPIELFLESSNACNYNCAFCAIQRFDPRPSGKSAMLSQELMRTVEPYLPGVATISLHGFGEPLLNPYTVKAAAEAASYNVHTEFFTNGMLLNRRRIQELVKTGVGKIIVSISTPDPDKYHRFYRNGKFHRVIEQLRILKEEKERCNSEFPRVAFNAIALRDTFPDLPNLVRLAGELGVSIVDLKPLVIYDNIRQIHDQRILYDPQRDEPVLEAAREVARQLGIALNLEIYEATGKTPDNADSSSWKDCHSDDKPKPQPCPLVFRSMYIHTNGMVKPCCFADDNLKLSLGSLHNQTIHSIWNGGPYREVRRAHLSGRIPSVCNHCMEFNLRPVSDSSSVWLRLNGISVYDPMNAYEKLVAMQSKVRRRTELLFIQGGVAKDPSIKLTEDLLGFALETTKGLQQGSGLIPRLSNTADSILHDVRPLLAVLESVRVIGEEVIVSKLIERQLVPMLISFPEKIENWRADLARAVESALV